jgi:hypothetical protein
MTNKYDNHTIVAACFMIQAVGVETMGSYGVFSTFWPMILAGPERLSPVHHPWHFSSKENTNGNA